MDIWVSPALHIMNEIAVAGSTTNARDEPAVVAGQNAGVWEGVASKRGWCSWGPGYDRR